jgi:hypothetical protein
MELQLRRIAVPPQLHLPAPAVGAPRSCPPSPAGWRARRACPRDRDQQAAGAHAARLAVTLRPRQPALGLERRRGDRFELSKSRSKSKVWERRAGGCEDELCAD